MGNVQLLKRVREQVVMYPDTHDQEVWHCGTTACIAGHAALMGGGKLQRNPGGWPELVDENGFVTTTPDFAAEKLQMNEDEKDYLFFCMDNETSVKRLDQVIGLWEEGKEFDYDINDEDIIRAPEYQCCAECG